MKSTESPYRIMLISYINNSNMQRHCTNTKMESAKP